MDDNLEHGGVHVDVDTKIPNDPLRPVLESVQLILYQSVEVKKSSDYVKWEIH